MTRYRFDLDDQYILCDDQPMGSDEVLASLEEGDQLRDELELAESKLAAIGELCPTHFDDREQLLGAITRILRGEIPETEESEP